MSSVESPFREDDAVARIQTLSDQRDALLAELRRLEGEIAKYRPWLWRRFFWGVFLTLGSALFVAIVVVRL